jgi:hypothetical protein
MYDATGYFGNGGGGGYREEGMPSPLSLTHPKYDEGIVSESVIRQWDVITMPDGTRVEECYVVPREGHKLTYIRFRYAIDARGRRSAVPCDVNAGVGRIKKRSRPTKAEVTAATAELEPAVELDTSPEATESDGE